MCLPITMPFSIRLGLRVRIQTRYDSHTLIYTESLDTLGLGCFEVTRHKAMIFIQSSVNCWTLNSSAQGDKRNLHAVDWVLPFFKSSFFYFFLDQNSNDFPLQSISTPVVSGKV